MSEVRSLNIKTGVVKRLSKDREQYIKDEKAQRLKVEKMENDKADFYDIKQQKEVLKEDRVMIEDSHKRLEAAVQDLTNLLSVYPEEGDEDLTKAIIEAKTALQKAQVAIGSTISD
ncbi:hypothetical protein H4219_001798 [Mycoemilia scoparia]|uniref:Tubulin-specific chaperone A n=1 Tax=Mycoemilia scoparia TaxID=417184 RepID=A0A9W8A058_9FUNG|nr:hypothetical protein H4219_001798 [Mycoemilia scoparia]